MDDDPTIREVVADVLRMEGYEVHVLGSGEEVLPKVQALDPALIVLDVMLPGLDGFEITRRLRRSSSVPIILLTVRDGELDKVQGFRLGVDDYVTKPFSPLELLMRVKAVLRRTGGWAGEPEGEAVLRCGDLVIDRAGRRVFRRGQPVALTAGEFNVLWALACHAGRVLTREQLMELAWGPEAVGGPESVTVLVSRIRDKLEDDPAAPRWIETVRGVGYRFKPE